MTEACPACGEHHDWQRHARCYPAYLEAELAQVREERDRWREAFQGKQLYPISEMEQKLAKVEVDLSEVREERDKIARQLNRYAEFHDEVGVAYKQHLTTGDYGTFGMAVQDAIRRLNGLL